MPAPTRRPAPARVVLFAIANGKIVEAETIVQYERLRGLDMAVLNG